MLTREWLLAKGIEVPRNTAKICWECHRFIEGHVEFACKSPRYKLYFMLKEELGAIEALMKGRGQEWTQELKEPSTGENQRPEL